MSALQQSNSFSAHLALAAGVSVSINAPTMSDLANVVGKLQPAEAANDAGATTGKSTSGKAAATAPAGSPATPTTAPSATTAAAAAAKGEAGNAAGAAGPSAAATPASSSTPAASPEVTFDTLKKAFLALSTKPDGRGKCEAVLKPFGKAKLSELAPEQYAAALAEINKASA